MKRLTQRLLLGGAGCALLVTAALSLPACTNTGMMTSSSAHSSGNSSVHSGAHLYQRANSRYYHCHPNGLCHNARDYYMHGMGGMHHMHDYYMNSMHGDYRSPSRPLSGRPR
ncbi:hypothetical protein [Microbulbifer sp. SAOS-129_SWC]|uniref:hypothetical protein n=1 Tax=Microbulbifer sp. SAOS-129_SWC TaxID=3145235 RepID=UPI003216F792